MLYKLTKLLILLSTVKNVFSFLQIQLSSENEVAKLLQDPNFNIKSIAVWSRNENSDFQKSIIFSVASRNFPLTLFTNDTKIVAKMMFEMIIIFIDSKDLVSSI